MLEFRLLGSVDSIVDGVPVSLGPRRQRLLFAVLALEANRLVPVDRLVGLSWPAARPRTAVHAIRVSASQLRSILAGTRAASYDVELVGNGSGYMLRTDSMRIDAHRFRGLVELARETSSHERKAALLREALGLWRGPALTGIGPLEARDGLARGLEEARLVALEDRVDAELALGLHREALAELTELAEAYPLRERFTGQLMVALYRSGQAAAALAEFHRTRRHLAEQLGIDPGAELRQLELAMLRNDATLAPPRLAQSRLAPPSSAEPSDLRPGAAVRLAGGGRIRAATMTGSSARRRPRRPAQLPPGIVDFTGRAAQQRELGEIVSERGGTALSPATIVIAGPAGVGKTALAVHWARQWLGLFRDGQLFIDLRGGAREQPLSTSAALGRFLRALGVPPDDVPSDPDEAVALYRTLLDGKQVLVILDNAATAQQVRPLLPAAPACAALITSRDPLSGLIARDGARYISLDVLPSDEGRALLARIIGRYRIKAEPMALDRLARACGHLPLALRMGAAYLVSHPHQDVGSYAARLERDDRLAVLDADGDEHAAVPATFDLSARASLGRPA